MVADYESLLAALRGANAHYVQSAIALVSAEADEARDIARLNNRMTLHVSATANNSAETVRPAR